MNKSNYLYIGIAIAVLVLAIIQVFNVNMLPIKLYAFIAWASVELTLLESLKTSANYIKELHKGRKEIIQKEIRLFNRHIDVLGRFDELQSDAELYQSGLKRCQKNLKRINADRRIKYLDVSVKVITIFQIVFLFVQLALLIVKNIPSDMLTNKTIDVLGLLSFSFLFFSYYMTNSTNDMMRDSKDKIDIADNLTKYYIDLMEKVANGKGNSDGNK